MRRSRSSVCVRKTGPLYDSVDDSTAVIVFAYEVGYVPKKSKPYRRSKNLVRT